MDDPETLTVNVTGRPDPELVEAWADALESGNYSQDRGYLKTKDGYCCLGVLCEVAMQRGVFKGHWTEDHHPRRRPLVVDHVPGDRHGIYDGHRTDLSLPPFMKLLVGLMTDCGELRDGSWLLPYSDEQQVMSRQDGMVEQEALSSANDEGHPFKDIGAAIRSTLLPRVRESAAQNQGQDATNMEGEL